MSEAVLILENMRGGCATVDGKVHTLFRFNGRRSRRTGELTDARPDAISADDIAEAIAFMNEDGNVDHQDAVIGSNTRT